MDLDKNLRNLMREKHYTIARLAEEAKVSPSNIKTWLGGGAPKKLEDVKKVCLVLGCSFEALIFGNNETVGGAEPPLFDEVVRLRIERVGRVETHTRKKDVVNALLDVLKK